MLTDKAGIRRDIGRKRKTCFFQNIRSLKILKVVGLRVLHGGLLILEEVKPVKKRLVFSLIHLHEYLPLANHDREIRPNGRQGAGFQRDRIEQRMPDLQLENRQY